MRLSPTVKLLLAAALPALALTRPCDPGALDLRGATPAPEAPRLRSGVLPFGFVENRGQWRPEARHALLAGPRAAYFGDGGWCLVSQEGERGLALRMQVTGSAARPVGEGEARGRRSWLRGGDPSAWVHGAEARARLRYREVAAGVDLVVRQADDPRALFEYDLELGRGADPAALRFEVEGHERLRVDADGSLVIATALGTWTQRRPRTFVLRGDGSREPLACGFVLHGPASFGFEVPGWDGADPVLIDPGLVWGTYFGGTGNDGVTDLVPLPGGDVAVCGSTVSTDLPTTTGAFDTSFNSNNPYYTDVFVARLTGDGKKLVFSTYIGGSANDIPYTLATMPDGSLVVAGSTASNDYPSTKGSLQPTFGGYGDGFVTRLAPSGTTLLWSTYFGGAGSSQEEVRALHVDRAGRVTLAGWARGGGLPTTTGAYMPKQPSTTAFNPFVAQLDPAGAKLQFSTFCGGTNFGMAKTVALDSNGNVLIAGHSGSSDYPTTQGAYQTSPGSTGLNYDAFLTKLDPTGSKLLWSTYLGGLGMDTIEAIRVVEGDDVVLAGWTRSTNFPGTNGVIQPFFAGGTNFRGDCFLTRINAAGSALRWSTYLGGKGGEEIRRLEVDPAGNLVVVGATGSTDFPVTKGAWRETGGGQVWSDDTFAARVSPDATRLLYSSYVFGAQYMSNSLLGLAIVDDGDAVLGGSTNQTAAPVTTGAFQGKHAGGIDGWVGRVDLLPTGVARVGTSSPCTGPLLLLPGGIFEAGKSSSFEVGNAPRSAPGVVAVGWPRAQPIVIAGAAVYLDPLVPIVTIPATTDKDGRASLPVLLTGLSKGLRFGVQTFWLGNASCTSGTLFTASAALDVTLQ
ncbi:MAG: hypothetical protein R3F30_01575 [Planctomycetota bacterium]